MLKINVGIRVYIFAQTHSCMQSLYYIHGVSYDHTCTVTIYTDCHYDIF